VTHGRVEVITSVERRRRWSAAEKQRLVAASLEPGASVSAIAREAGIDRGQLYAWRRQLRARQGIRFAPVQIAAEVGPPDVAAEVGPSDVAAEVRPADVVGQGAIEIEFASGARMRITGAVAGRTVAAAVAALAERGRR